MIRSIAKLAFIVLLLGHGLIYLLGFLKAFDLAQVNELTQVIWSRPLGFLWLLAALLFIVTAVAFALKKRWWWPTASEAADRQPHSQPGGRILASSKSDHLVVAFEHGQRPLRAAIRQGKPTPP